MANEKILIIDDDEDLVASMKMVLEKNSYKVEAVLSGEEGFKAAKQIKPDLILLDVMMEKVDKGFEIARRIKKEPSLAKIPILMSTAIRETTGIDFKGEAGDENWLPVDDYVEKPMQPDVLLAKVEKLLKK